jgi:hypothetical protein
VPELKRVSIYIFLFLKKLNFNLVSTLAFVGLPLSKLKHLLRLKEAPLVFLALAFYRASPTTVLSHPMRPNTNPIAIAIGSYFIRLLVIA